MAVEIEESNPTQPASERRSMPGGLTLGLAAKVVFLATINATSIWALGQLVPEGVWLGVAFLVVATVAINLIYLTTAHWAIPFKYLLPGTLFLLAFQ